MIVRAWALGVPAVIALFWTPAAGTRVGDRWDQAKSSPLMRWAAGQAARIVRRHGALNVNVSGTPRPAAASAAVRWTGVECVVDASGCDPDALRSPAILQALFRDVVLSLGLTPIGTPMWHTFPGAGGVTGITMLSESHLSVHTYPETGFAAFDLYCCRPHVEWPWKEKLVAALGARDVNVRVMRRG
jgi:S-adenosylmethionine decarboxylase